MKASALKVRSKSNIASTDAIEMSFDVKGQAKLAAILIDLYSDLWAAIIREYTANGWDSHVSAGQKRPVEVTLPTFQDQVFKVKDYGLGMDMDDIREIYSKYGASTKDLDNDQIGSYGLGCKSALSVSPSFTVTAIKNGVKNVVIVSREENSLGKITPVVQIETDEPNGVEISIPVDGKPQDFSAKADQVFFTWPQGSVLIDGNPPAKSMYDESKFLHLGDKAFMSHEKANGYSYGGSDQGLMVNMGGIGYPVNDNQYRLLLDTARRQGCVSPGSITEHRLIITVPLGTVDLVPSREGIRWSQKSTNTVVGKLKETMGLILSSIQNRINTIDNREDLFCKEFFELGKSFPDYFREGHLTWNDEKFPKSISFEKAPSTDKSFLDCAVSYNNNRMTKSYSGPVFHFGFDSRKASVEVSDKRIFDSQWVLVDCRNTEATPAELHHHVKSLSKSRSLSNNVTIAYIVEDTIYSNPWIIALLKKGNTNLLSLTADELIAESKEYRKKQARLNRSNAKAIESEYTVSVVMGTEGSKKRIDTTMKPSQIEKLLEDNPDMQVFADEVIFSTANKDYAFNAMFFLPDTALIVYMRGARKAAAFVKKVDFNVRTDLADYLAETMVEKIGQVSFKDYFSELHLGYELCGFGSRLNMPEGFLKECFKESKRYSAAGIVLEHMNKVKEMEGSIFPEIDYVIKSREILEVGALFFEDPQPWNISRRSKAYQEQIAAYLISISDKIDAIANA